MINFYALVIYTTITTITYGDETVKYAAVIFRHGDRVPVETYPTDPWRNESLWPVKFGELTNNGKMQQYVFGKLLRKRYSHLLSPYFDPTEFYIRSTDVDRTLMSAQANLAGLYPPYDKSIWNPDLMWQPIPVHTKPPEDDELLAMEKPCPAYSKEMDRFINSKPFKEKLNSYHSLMEYLSQKTGMEIKTFHDVEDLYSTLHIETLYNFTLPNWTHSVYPDKMREPACYSFSIDTDTPLLARLKVGPLLKHITKSMKKVISKNEGKKYHKVQLYSGHDLTVGSLLNSLGVYDGNCPCYTSAVFFELIVDNSTCDPYVKVSYRNNTGLEEPFVLNIPNCGTKCPVNKFIKLYDNLISVNWDYECNKQFPPLLAASFIIGLCIFATIYIAHKIHFARVYQRNRDNLQYVNIMVPADTIKMIDV